jgi:hypothetical protein
MKIVWNHPHPDFPKIKDTLRETVDFLGVDHYIFGVRLLTILAYDENDEGTHTKIYGWQVITADPDGKKGITEFGLDGYAVRDSMIWSV